MALNLAELEDSCRRLAVTLTDERLGRDELLDASMVVLAVGYYLGPIVARTGSEITLPEIQRAHELLRSAGDTVRRLQSQSGSAPEAELHEQLYPACLETLDALRLVARIQEQSGRVAS